MKRLFCILLPTISGVIGNEMPEDDPRGVLQRLDNWKEILKAMNRGRP